MTSAIYALDKPIKPKYKIGDNVEFHGKQTVICNRFFQKTFKQWFYFFDGEPDMVRESKINNLPKTN